MSGPGSRGQALVEMALGVLVVTTILLFGIFFAELGYVQLKVQEAATNPLWESTNGQMHDLWGGGWNLWTPIAGDVGARSQGLYQDLDGLSSRNGSTTLMYAVTETTGLQLNCANDPTVPFMGAPATLPGNPFPRGDSGVSCIAQANAVNIGIPSVFVDAGGRGGIFKVPHGRFTIPVCGAGRGDGSGTCRGKFGLVLDDWGFFGPNESQDCGLYICANTVYRDMAKGIYDANGQAWGTDAAILAAASSGNPGGGAPIDENTFFFSAQMSEKEFKETLRMSHGSLEWETTPYIYGWKDAYAGRDDGWLGYANPPQVW